VLSTVRTSVPWSLCPSQIPHAHTGCLRTEPGPWRRDVSYPFHYPRCSDPKNWPCGLPKLVFSHLFQYLTSHGHPTTCLFATEGTRHYEPVWGCTGAVAAWTHTDGNVYRRRCCCRCCRHIGRVNEHSTQKQK